MLATLWTIIFFLLAITLLVIIHECGHFLVARWFNVRILRFSVGLGKPFWSYTDKKGTQFVLAPIPIGGYVKMLDEREGSVPEKDLSFAFNRQPLGRRFLIILAGPVFNLLFAVLAYWLMFMIGITQVVPMIGEVTPNSIAANAGVVANTEIVKIEETLTPSWQSVESELMIQMRNKNTVTIQLNDQSGKTVKHTLSIQDTHKIISNLKLVENLGIIPYSPPISLIVGQVNENSPASSAGFKSGDTIIALNKTAFADWQALVDFTATHPNQKVTFTILRDGNPLELPVTIGGRKTDQGTVEGFLGVVSLPLHWPENLLRVERYSAWPAFKIASTKTIEMSFLSLELMWKMLSGIVSWHNISGPIGIAKSAGVSASLGISYYLSFLALVSLSLGIVNLLPIPILDGGHLLYCLVELATRKPVSEVVQMMGAKIGIIILLAVMVLAFYNDLAQW